MMNMKIIPGLVVTFFFGLSQLGNAQSARIGILGTRSASQSADRISAIRQGLSALGYIAGKNIVIEYKWAEGRIERLPELAAELVRLKVELIIAIGGTPAIQAAKDATSTIPILFSGLGTDPVELGFVASFARPGGNITGFGSGGPELYGKRLELLKETVPGLSRVAYLRNQDNPAARLTQDEIRAAARVLGLQIRSVEVRKADELVTAFQTATRAQAGGLIVAQTPPINSEVEQVVKLSIKSRLPAIYAEKNWPDAGGLMSYSSDNLDGDRRVATYVDKILKGDKPADLPVQQPMKFELIINLKSAKQIGLTISPNVLVRADKVIR
jgi:putative ABC transport system substrate-binding protein